MPGAELYTGNMEYTKKLKDLNRASTFNNIYRHCVYFHCFENFCDGLLAEVYFVLCLAQQPPEGQGLIIHEVSRSHSR